MGKPLRVMKFGGTSVGDASAILKVVDIVQSAAHESTVAVVVSAMSGVTNKLLEAASCAESGDQHGIARIFEGLFKQHAQAAAALIPSAEKLETLTLTIRATLCEGERRCKDALLLGKMPLAVRDELSGIGERLSAPLLAAALAQNGVSSQWLNSAELVVTNAHHGDAEPLMDLTRERCQARLQPILRSGVVPVITGFIGATIDGALTTLGRGGSDYSATILGAALQADEVIIWTDVDGVLTADPRLVPAALTIPEISYREATELASWGAKVIHPKTLAPLHLLQTPVWIRNTFAPDRPGTKITAAEVPCETARAAALMGDVALLTMDDAEGFSPTLFDSLVSDYPACRRILPISDVSSIDSVHFHIGLTSAKCFVAPSSLADAIQLRLSAGAGADNREIAVKPGIAVIALVGTAGNERSAVAARALAALRRCNVDEVAVGRAPSECTLLFIVPAHSGEMALNAIHDEFQLSVGKSQIVGLPELPQSATA